METVLMLLAVAGLAFFLKDAEGPFGLFSMLRNLLMRIPLVGSTVVRVFDCNFCLGAWSGLALYLFTNGISSWNLGKIVVWMCGSGFWTLLVTSIVNKNHLDLTEKE